MSNQIQDSKAKSFYFGAKVRFKGTNTEYCLLGYNEYLFTLIEWDKRGGLSFDNFLMKPHLVLELVEVANETN